MPACLHRDAVTSRGCAQPGHIVASKLNKYRTFLVSSMNTSRCASRRIYGWHLYALPPGFTYAGLVLIDGP